MIYLLTGQPGHGKTLRALWWVRTVLSNNGERQVYYSGIKDLRIPGWIELTDATQWHKVEPNSIVVIDECQRIFRPRGNGAVVPEHVSAAETHRHGGIDAVLITQHPMLLDANIRRLVEKHWHVVRQFGTTYARVFEWPRCNEQPDKSKKNATVKEWRYPAEVYGWYSSAEVHTVRRSIPWWVYAVVIVTVLAGWMVFRAWGWLAAPKIGPASVGAPAPGAPASAAKGVTLVKGSPAEVDAYLASYKARLPGLPHTAPVYDGVTEPAHAPYPAACVQMADQCRCYTDQATRIDVPEALCASIVARGYFVAWQQQKTAPSASAPRPQAAPSLVSGIGGMGGTPMAPVEVGRAGGSSPDWWPAPSPRTAAPAWSAPAAALAAPQAR